MRPGMRYTDTSIWVDSLNRNHHQVRIYHGKTRARKTTVGEKPTPTKHINENELTDDTMGWVTVGTTVLDLDGLPKGLNSV